MDLAAVICRPNIAVALSAVRKAAHRGGVAPLLSDPESKSGDGFVSSQDLKAGCDKNVD